MSRAREVGSGLVYSTEGGRMCPRCRCAVASCRCAAAAAAARPAGDGIARVGRETQHRGGRAVTVVRGLALDDTALAALGKRLRAACGAGGTVKAGCIEVQGEHVERVLALLQQEGLKAKRGGG